MVKRKVKLIYTINCEGLFIQIADVEPVLIATVYRRPSTDLETFAIFFSNKLDIVKSDINMLATYWVISI